MAQQTINIGTNADDGTGDPLRTAMDKINDNFTEIYTELGGSSFSDISFTGTTISTDTTNANLTLDPNGTGSVIVNGTLTATAISGPLTGDVTGNADTASALATARSISLAGDVVGSASFDGSSNISITATIQSNSVALGTDTTGNYVAVGATSGSGISGSVSAEGGTFTVTSNATNVNTPNTIVFRDNNGDFTAGTITANTYVGGVQQITGPGAVNTITLVTEITTTGTDAFTLANGVLGQLKYIVAASVAAGNATLTPTTFANGTTITFNSANDAVQLLYMTNGWTVISNSGAAIA